MPRALKPCSIPGCPEIAEPGRSRCADCQQEAERKRGTSTARGYNARHRNRFRRAVLRRDPICTVCHSEPSTVADHYPLSRRELELRGLNPYDPRYGRGLGQRCHSKETAQHQPGGWHTP